MSRKSKHHRKQKFRGGGNSKRNISIVTQREHDAWNVLFKECTPHQVADIMNAKWIDPSYLMIVERR